MNARNRIGLLIEAQGARRAESEIKGVARSVDDVGDKATRSGRKMAAVKGVAASFSGGLRKLAKAAKYGALMVAGLGIAIGRSAISEYREAAKAARQTNAVIESTGGVANVTAKHVGNLSNKLSLQAGIDDEVIQQGANLLLTFKKIRNEVGKGNKVFDRANQSALDLSAAGFGSLESTSKQMGKALNDPVKGITALGRAGVTFTDDQKDLIKSLVEQNDLLGAQKIILKEVESQVAGSAKAQADPIDRAQVAWANLMETIGTKAAPYIEKAALAVAKFVRQMQNGKGAGGQFVAFLRDYAIPTIKWLATAAINAGKWLVGAFKNVRNWVVANWPTIRKILAGIAWPFVNIVAPAAVILWDVLKKVHGWIKDNWPTIKGVLKAAAWPITNVFIPALKTAKRIGEWAFNAIKAVVGFVGDKIEWVADKIQKVIDAAGKVKEAFDFIPNPGGGIDDFLNDAGVTVDGERAAGGPVRRSGTYLVGEEGPELFVPNSAGAIIPNGSSSGSDPASQRAFARMIAEELARVPPQVNLDGRQVTDNVRGHALRAMLATSPA